MCHRETTATNQDSWDLRTVSRFSHRDHGWIHTLLEEAENERLHLLTFLKLKQPGPVFRFMVLVSQGVMFNAFFLAYIIPKTCHRFVGYIEEEAVHTYTVVRAFGCCSCLVFSKLCFALYEVLGYWRFT